MGEIRLSVDDLRAVTSFCVASAEEVLALFEAEVPDDPRPREALDAARAVADGERRSRRQRVAAMDAHRAGTGSPSPVARHAALAAADAAASAYLHPLRRATQVGHILRASAHAARVHELVAGDDPAAGLASLAQARRHATPTLVDVLLRYPPAPTGRTRVAELMLRLDTDLRAGDRPS